MLTELKTIELLDRLASGDPVPGGGSAGALIGAVAASLVAMVARLTMTKKSFEGVRERMQAIAAHAMQLRQRLTAAVDADAEAYTRVLAAMRLPKTADQEKDARQKAIQAAVAHAARVPLQTALDAAAVLELAAQVHAEGIAGASSDALVAVMAACAAVRAGVGNVRINLQDLTDRRTASQLEAQAADLEARAALVEDRVLARRAPP
jgi:formiminotetrahydrofolate cyclodeaminase